MVCYFKKCVCSKKMDDWQPDCLCSTFSDVSKKWPFKFWQGFDSFSLKSLNKKELKIEFVKHAIARKSFFNGNIWQFGRADTKPIKRPILIKVSTESHFCALPNLTDNFGHGRKNVWIFMSFLKFAFEFQGDFSVKRRLNKITFQLLEFLTSYSWY